MLLHGANQQIAVYEHYDGCHGWLLCQCGIEVIEVLNICSNSVIKRMPPASPAAKFVQTLND